MSDAGATRPRLLNPASTAAVVLGAHDWTEAGLGRAPSFLRSARGIVAYLYDSAGMGLSPELVLDLFDDPTSAGEQLARVRDTLDVLLRERRDEGRPVSDLLVYYVGHGYTDDEAHLSLLVRRSRRGLEAETGIKAPDLARTLRLAAPQQRRSVILDCCFSEAAAKAFIGQGPDLNQEVAATAAKDLGDEQPSRGTLLLCSSPIGQISIGAANAEHTLFTGSALNVLRHGVEGRPPVLSFADLRDAAFERMVSSFGANAPRPALHQVNAAHGDLTRAPAFENRALARATEQPTIPIDTAPPQPSVSASPPSGVSQQPAIDTAPPEPSGSSPSSPGVPKSLYRYLWTVSVFVVVCAATINLILISDQTHTIYMAPTPSATDNHQSGRQQMLAGNDTQVARLDELAADQGNATGQTQLGDPYEWKDDTQAARLNEVAATGQAQLGDLYESGRGGLPKDDTQAARLKLAADQGNADAQAHLGIYYEFGRGGLPQDDTQAARLFKLAANQGNATGQARLGELYESGRGGLPQDIARAARLYKLAANQGNATGQARLGELYESGRGGLPQDITQAARLYKLAANQGNATGQADLGVYYEFGRGGLPQDDTQAARLYKLAADQGNATGQAQLGDLYESGRGGLPQDVTQAARLYKLAADQGNAYARSRLQSSKQRQ
jgi:TPR repeat protein